MKRICSAFLAVLFYLSLASSAFATEGQSVSVSSYHGSIVIDGVRVSCQLNEKEGKSPLVCNGTKYVPLMTAGQWLGADITYDEVAKAITVTHNGKGPAHPSNIQLAQQGVTFSQWWESGESHSAQLLSDVTVLVDGEPRSFADIDGRQVYPLQCEGTVLLPLQVICQLSNKQMVEHSLGFANYIYLFDAPTQMELNSARDYLSTVREHLNAVRDVVEGARPKTQDECTEKVRQIQSHLAAVWTLPAPMFPAMTQCVKDLIQYQAELVLWQNIDCRLPAVENSGANPFAWDGAAPLVATPLLLKEWDSLSESLITKEIDSATYFMGLEDACTYGESLLTKVFLLSVFSDASGIQHPNAVAALTQLGVIHGRGNGNFTPAGTVTRAEMAKMISVTLNGGSESVNSIKAEPSFSDISGHWAEGYIEYCADLGILSGRGNGTFAPDDNVTGLEATKMALAMLGYDPAAYRLTGSVWAIRTDELARHCDPRLYAELDGVDINAPISRENAAQILYNALQNKPKIIASQTAEDGSVTWEFKTNDKTLLEDRFNRTWDEVGVLPVQPE